MVGFRIGACASLSSPLKCSNHLTMIRTWTRKSPCRNSASNPTKVFHLVVSHVLLQSLSLVSACGCGRVRCFCPVASRSRHFLDNEEEEGAIVDSSDDDSSSGNEERDRMGRNIHIQSVAPIRKRRSGI